jgi:hypothetical protein
MKRLLTLARTPEARVRLLLVAVFALTAVSVGVLAAWDVGTTEVLIEVPLTGFSAKLSADWHINGLRVTKLGVSHASYVKFSAAQASEVTRTSHPRTLTGPMRLTGVENYWSATVNAEDLTANIMIAAGSTVRVSASDQARGGIRFEISNGRVDGSVDAPDTYELTCNICLFEHTKQTAANRRIRVTGGESELSFADRDGSLAITLLLRRPNDTRGALLLATGLAISELDCSALEGTQRSSTVAGPGIIRFAELDGKKIEVRAGDFLQVRELGRFQIKRLVFDEGLKAEFEGVAGALGTGTTRRYIYSRLPSRLHWLHANRSIQLYLATLLPVFTTILAVLSGLRILRTGER